MRYATFGWRNWLLEALLTAGNQVADLNVGQLQNDQGSPATAWQTNAGVLTPEAGAWMRASLPAAQSWGALALCRTNLTAAAQVRWRIGGPAMLAARSTPSTDTAAGAGAGQGAATTRTGSVSGGTAYTNAAGTSFVRPGTPTVVGGYSYAITAAIRRTSAGSSTAGSAIIAEYRDTAGALVRSRLPMTALLPTTDWQQLSLRFTPPVSGGCNIYLAADTGALQYELGAATFGQVPELDTGLIAANVQPGYLQTVLVPPATPVGTLCQLDISDPSNPDGFLNVPLAYAGQAWTSARNITSSSAPGATAEVDEVVTRGGQEWPSMRFARRHWQVSHQSILAGEVWSQLGEMLRVAQRGGNVLFVPDPDSAEINREAVLGRLTSQSDRTNTTPAGELRGWSGKIAERL
jgi:hypothetical protein